MLRFAAGDGDVLVCTTIIEAGLDLPNVNTIIVSNAHQFGLSQLYQLRGRVGRYKHRAYCYLLLPETRALTDVAQRRLRAGLRPATRRADAARATLQVHPGQERGNGTL